MAKNTCTEVDVKAGQRLKTVRKDTLGISSQYTLAEETGTSQSTIASYENGTMEMGTKFLVTLYEKYGVMSHYILNGKGPIKESPEDKKALVTDLAHMKAQISVLTAKVEYLSGRMK